MEQFCPGAACVYSYTKVALLNSLYATTRRRNASKVLSVCISSGRNTSITGGIHVHAHACDAAYEFSFSRQFHGRDCFVFFFDLFFVRLLADESVFNAEDPF